MTIKPRPFITASVGEMTLTNTRRFWLNNPAGSPGCFLRLWPPFEMRPRDCVCRPATAQISHANGGHLRVPYIMVLLLDHRICSSHFATGIVGALNIQNNKTAITLLQRFHGGGGESMERFSKCSSTFHISYLIQTIPTSTYESISHISPSRHVSQCGKAQFPSLSQIFTVVIYRRPFSVYFLPPHSSHPI